MKSKLLKLLVITLSISVTILAALNYIRLKKEKRNLEVATFGYAPKLVGTPSNLKNKKYRYIKSIPDAADYTYGFSKYAKPGKISLFIISAHWCAPCYALKNKLEEDLKSGKINPEIVDVYDYTLTKSKRETLEDLRQKPSYRHTSMIDKLTKVFPTTYITTQTTNCYTIVEGSKYDDILKHISDLMSVNKYFNINSFQGRVSSVNVPPSIPNQALLEENTQLKTQIQELESQLDLRSHVNPPFTHYSNEYNQVLQVDEIHIQEYEYGNVVLWLLPSPNQSGKYLRDLMQKNLLYLKKSPSSDFGLEIHGVRYDPRLNSGVSFGKKQTYSLDIDYTAVPNESYIHFSFSEGCQHFYKHPKKSLPSHHLPSESWIYFETKFKFNR
ncbi:hypothetical protein [Phaeodactylibacter sp.]|uniref:hypothetical protein n=1 Tax=Phaeodactylibacter sp. TaxID=1940289 RepID=UPI0025CD238F|nr:hypothetical protein [Phaeodactylibacter sp.]MCI5091624.1 hypothetical protein [Phaeodactylibacter sp.]